MNGQQDGRGTEDETDSMRLWVHCFDPRQGGMSEDPIGLAGGINPYIFGGGDPVNHRDPTGAIYILMETPNGHVEMDCTLEGGTWVCVRIRQPGIGVTARPYKDPTSGITWGSTGSSPGALAPRVGSILRTARNFISHPCTRAWAGVGITAIFDALPAARLLDASFTTLKAAFRGRRTLRRVFQDMGQAAGPAYGGVFGSFLEWEIGEMGQAFAQMTGDLAPGEYLSWFSQFVPGVSTGQAVDGAIEICSAN